MLRMEACYTQAQESYTCDLVPMLYTRSELKLGIKNAIHKIRNVIIRIKLLYTRSIIFREPARMSWTNERSYEEVCPGHCKIGIRDTGTIRESSVSKIGWLNKWIWTLGVCSSHVFLAKIIINWLTRLISISWRKLATQKLVGS